MHIHEGNMNGQIYRDLVLKNIEHLRFVNLSLASRPLYMSDVARQHRTRLVTANKDKETIDTIFFALNVSRHEPYEYVRDAICRNLKRRDSPLKERQLLMNGINLIILSLEGFFKV